MSKLATMLLARTGPMIGHLQAYGNNLTAIIPDLYEGMDVVSRELTGFIAGASRAPGVEAAALNQNVRYLVSPELVAQDTVAQMSISEPPDVVMDNGFMAI